MNKSTRKLLLILLPGFGTVVLLFVVTFTDISTLCLSDCH